MIHHRFAVAVAQPEGVQEELFGGCQVRVGVEAGISMGWHRWVGPAGALVTLDRFGASGPGGEVMAHFGFTPENVAETARRALGRAERDH